MIVLNHFDFEKRRGSNGFQNLEKKTWCSLGFFFFENILLRHAIKNVFLNRQLIFDIRKKNDWPFKFRDDRVLKTSKKLFYFVTFLMLCVHRNFIYLNCLHHCYTLGILMRQKSGILTLCISKWRKFLNAILNKIYFNFRLDNMQPHLFCYPVFKKRLLKSPSKKFFSRYFKNGTQFTNACWTNVFKITKTFFWHHGQVLQN